MSGRSSEELRRELMEAEEREFEAMEARRREVPVRYRYTLTPEEPERRWREVYDPSCRLYRLSGEVVNREEALLVGHSPDGMMSGEGMTYVFNGLSGLFVTGVGGGRILVSGDGAQATFELLSSFVRTNPEGGDVTEIITSHEKD